ncbi:acyltransferase [Aestuariicella sp. G3-2]|uniref:acyltransferase family protein n=1 Tax=Pseudomaricurvus albidus TaxID=2842452 RepID=UPI001C0BB19A|nr:acyltransferase family protein [Aestuariicella albida]MBU3071034.1 acyltransferase [Aestuariicella albida]
MESVPPTPNKLYFRTDIQGLRAIAVLLVIFCHANISPFTGGYVGVDIFFVISGYLISGLLINEYQQSKNISFIGFYSRRFKRLLPALITMLLASIVAAEVFLSDSDARTLLRSLPYAATWTSNLFFSFQEVSYFDELATKDLFLHTWSLGVEEQFYIIWPLLILGLFNSRYLKNKISTFFIALTLAGVFISIIWTQYNANTAFYLMPSRIWQFSLGALVYYLKTRSSQIASPKFASYSFYFGILGISLILTSSIFFNQNMAYPGYWSLLPSIGAALLLATGDRTPNNSHLLLNNPILKWIGDRSYSLYLWHWPILILGNFADLTRNSYGIGILLTTTLIVSAISYRFIEKPLWKMKTSKAHYRTIIMASALAMIVMIPLNILVNSQSIETSNQRNSLANARIDMPVIYTMNCDSWFRDAKVQPCTFNSEQAEYTMVILADSIGAQWFTALQSIYPSPEWEVIVFTKSSCPMVDENYFYQRIGKVFTVCSEWRDEVLTKIEDMKPDVVFVGSASTYPFSSSEWVQGSKRIYDRLAKATIQTFIIAGTPNLSFDGPTCLSMQLLQNGKLSSDTCTEPAHLAQTKKVSSHLEAAAQPYSNMQVIDLSEKVCPNNTCSAVTKDGIVVFRDSRHLTDTFVQSLKSELHQRLQDSQPSLHLNN